MEEKTKLEMCAEEIHKLELDILDREINLAQDVKKAALIEADMKEKIANKVGADGKPLYSNDAKRSAALLNMSISNVLYCDLLGFNQKSQRTIAELRIELNYQRNMFEVYKRIGQ